MSHIDQMKTKQSKSEENNLKQQNSMWKALETVDFKEKCIKYYKRTFHFGSRYNIWDD